MSMYPLTLKERILGGELIRYAEAYYAFPVVSKSTDHYFPPSGYYLSLMNYKRKTFMIYADTQPVDVVLEDSFDHSTYKPVAGANIASADFETDKWNYIHTDIVLKYPRLKITTGATAPNNLIVWVKAL